MIDMGEQMGNFSVRLKVAMDKGGFTGADVARHIGVQKNRISQWLGMTEIPPAMESLVKASQVLGVSLDWLLLGKEADPVDELVRMIRRLSEAEQAEVKGYVEYRLTTSVKASQELTRKTSG